ncbi:cytochrome C assembly family protein [Thermomonas sp.]|uniref:cytochrome C assembly family protein n=1 Tax=Thermomonas sp. TaxID=1971895 RepID=UPI003D0E03F0
MLIPAIAIALYLVATVLLWRTAAGGHAQTRGWVPVAALALLFHAETHVEAWRLLQGPDMHFFAALSLVGIGMAALTTIYGASGRMPALGIVVFPLSALALLGYLLYGHADTASRLDWRLQLHAWLALLAYATLALAAVLAIFLWAQERALRRREFHAWLRALPPLTELETLLFRSIAVGFVLLSATLLTGVLFVENLLAQHLVHKTVLSVLSWLAFGALLLGRWRRGWRGATAVRWTLAAMALLVLAFFGSKFVLELVLHRAG